MIFLVWGISSPIRLLAGRLGLAISTTTRIPVRAATEQPFSVYRSILISLIPRFSNEGRPKPKRGLEEGGELQSYIRVIFSFNKPEHKPLQKGRRMFWQTR